METHGLIETSNCDEPADNDLEGILRAISCQSFVSGGGTDKIDVDQVYSLVKKHLELDGVQCGGPGESLIGGHCVSCDSLCEECFLENTNGLVYGFYLDENPIKGDCMNCVENSTLDTLRNECVCNESFFYEGNGQCSQCS